MRRYFRSYGVEERGAVLIQYLCITGAVMVLLTASVSDLRSLRSLMSLRGQSSLVESAIRRLWVAAVISGKEGYLEFDHDSYLLFVEGEQVEARKLRSGAVFESNRRLHFSERGVVSPATIELRNKRSRCRMFVSLYGRTRQECRAR